MTRQPTTPRSLTSPPSPTSPASPAWRQLVSLAPADSRRTEAHVGQFTAEQLAAPVLLVGGTPMERVAYSTVLRTGLVAAPTIRDLGELLDAGWSGNVALVDFHLGPRHDLGLHAMVHLERARPEVGQIIHTNRQDSAAVMYAAAARHWRGVASLVDTAEFDPCDLPRVLATVAAGNVWLPRSWEPRLRHAALIGRVLAHPEWVTIWRAMYDSAGDMQLAGAMLGVSPAQLRGFKERVIDGVNAFRNKLGDVPHPGETRNKKGILAAFAAEHRSFLSSPGLSQLMTLPRGPGPHRR